MGKQLPIELFMPPNILKAKAGGDGKVDLEAIARAETALDSLKENFFDWLTSDVDKLIESHKVFADSKSKETSDALFRASHDMKGQAATFGYPIVSRIAGSLCKLIEEVSGIDKLPAQLVEAHVQTIHVMHRQNIKDGTHPTAVVLCKELEARTAEALAA